MFYERNYVTRLKNTSYANVERFHGRSKNITHKLCNTHRSILTSFLLVDGNDEVELEFSKLNRAKPSWGISIFELKSSCHFFMYSFFSTKLFLFLALTNLWTILRRKVPYKIFWKSKGNKKKYMGVKKCQFSDFRAEIKFSSWREKVTSWAALSWRVFSSIYGSRQQEVWFKPDWLEPVTNGYNRRGLIKRIFVQNS